MTASADSCVLWTGFDISIVSRNYAQFAGILAGFAFVVINLVLDRGYRRRAEGKSLGAREIEHETLTGVALVSAFFGLFLAALQYSLLAGENGCSLTGGRAASAELLGGVSFVASVYMLLYAVVQFVSGTAAGSLPAHCVFIVAVLVPPIAVFFVEATITDLAIALADPQTHQPLRSLWEWGNRLAIPIPLAVFIVCGAVWYIGIRRRRSESPADRIARSVRTVLPYLTIAVVISAIVRSVGALPVTNPQAHLAPGEAWLWVFVFTALMLGQSIALSFQSGVESALASPNVGLRHGFSSNA